MKHIFFLLAIIASLTSIDGYAIIVKRNFITDPSALVNNHKSYCPHRRQDLAADVIQIRNVTVDFGILKINTKTKTLSFRPGVTETFCTFYGRSMQKVLQEYGHLLVGRDRPRVFQVALFFIKDRYRRPIPLAIGKTNYSFYQSHKSILNPKRKRFKTMTYDTRDILKRMKEGDEVTFAIDYALATPRLPQTKYDPRATYKEANPASQDQLIAAEKGAMKLSDISDTIDYDYFSYEKSQSVLRDAEGFLRRKVGRKLRIQVADGPRFTFIVQKTRRGYRIYKERWHNQNVKVGGDIARGDGDDEKPVTGLPF